MAPASFPLYSPTPPLPFPLFLCARIAAMPENFIAKVCRQQRRPSSNSMCRGTTEAPLLHHCSPLSQVHPLTPLACLYSQQIEAGSSIRSARRPDGSPATISGQARTSPHCPSHHQPRRDLPQLIHAVAFAGALQNVAVVHTCTATTPEP
jgi:hypothetical protein